MALWRASQALVLASQSAARRMMLEAAGLEIAIQPAAIDERAVEKSAAAQAPDAVAALLAREKAMAVSAKLPERLVVGADQVLALGGERFSKPHDRAGARAQLQTLRGKTHALHSAVAVVRDGRLLFEHGDAAHLTMRAFSDVFLETYLDEAGADVTASVGGYQLERHGIQLFERVTGDYFTILGLPMIPLLAFLRQEGWLAQ